MPQDLSLTQRTDFILADCAGKKVLHLGCTNYPYTHDSIEKEMLLHDAIKKVASDLYGFDADQAGIDILNELGFTNIYLANLEHLGDVALDDTFDVIIGGDMLEHLNNPGSFLHGIKRFMHADTRFILTTINAYGALRFLLYGFRGKRGRQEFVHPDHVAYYSYSTLKVLVERHGMRLDSLLFYDIGREHRPHNRWFLNALNDICVSIAPQWADGLIAVCKL
jgi:predicted TPR repeat methyltransferase